MKRAITFSLTLAALALPPTPARAAPPRYNVLLIVADDLTCDLACYGNTAVKSPNIDRLAATGMRFDRCYSQYPLCNPSRISFLSGRRPESLAVFDNDTDPRRNLAGVELLPEYFHNRGYFTACFGKVAHTGWQSAVSFDLRYPQSPRPTPKPATPTPQKSRRQPQSAPRPASAPPLPSIDWGPLGISDAETPDGDRARRLIAMLQQKRDRPFFAAMGFEAPHEPFRAPRRYHAMYPPSAIALPVAPLDDRDDLPPYALLDFVQTVRFTADDVRQIRSSFYACISFLDAQIGLILDALDRTGQADNTIIVFTSDHGVLIGEHRGAWRKLSLFEQCARVPLIIRAPKALMPALAAHTSPRLVELVDLFPTLADLCSLPPPPGVEGLSFRPLLSDPQQPWKKAAFTTVQRLSLGHSRRPSPANPPPLVPPGIRPFGFVPATQPAGGGILAVWPDAPFIARSLRTERYRYSEWLTPDMAELYDHNHDPGEFHNLAADPAAAALRAELHRMLTAGWQAALPSHSPASQPR